MMRSYKSYLLELLQKEGLSTSIFKTTRVGGEDHTPTYTSEIEIKIFKQKYSLKGEPKHSKKEAEQNISEKLLTLLLPSIEVNLQGEKDEFWYLQLKSYLTGRTFEELLNERYPR